MDCPHGQLRRACEMCDLAAENEQLRKCKPTQADTLAWVRRQWPDKCTPLDRAAANGGTGDPIEHSYAEQKAVARTLLARRGLQPWPACGARL